MVYGPPAGFYRNKAVVKVYREFCTGCMTCVENCRRQRAPSCAPPATEKGSTQRSSTPTHVGAAVCVT